MNQFRKLSIVAVSAIVACTTLAKSSSKDDEDYNENAEYLTFSLDTLDFPDKVGDADVLTECLPEGVEVAWTGKKLKTPKASAPKVKKVDGEYEIVISEKGENNPSGLKLSYKAKTGNVSGSFKVYAVYEGKKGKLKLKKYSAKVSGNMGDEKGLTAKISKIGTYSATLE